MIQLASRLLDRRNRNDVNSHHIPQMKRPLLASLCLSVAFCSAQSPLGKKPPVSVPAADKPPRTYILPKDKDIYFRRQGANLSFYRFMTDGTYREICCDHFYDAESDHGSWSQETNGYVVLVSRRHIRNIDSGPLWINMFDTNLLSSLPTVIRSISNVLAFSASEQFSSEGIRSLTQGSNSGRPGTLILEDGVKEVRREQLVEFISTVTRYINDPLKNQFRVIPMQYKGVVFLLLLDSDTALDLPTIQRLITNAREHRRMYPDFVYCETDKRTFEKESGKPGL